MFGVLITVAASCVLWPLVNAAVAGLTLTATKGSSVTVADDVAVMSA